MLAQCSRIACTRAIASEAANLIDAFAVVLARRRCTVIPVDLAIRPGEPLHAFAFEFVRVRSHFACAIIQAWLRLAQRMHTDFHFATDAGILGGALAMIVAAIVLRAGGPVFAWLRLARRPSVNLTVLAVVSRCAMTFIAVRSGYATTMLHARLVHAVIERSADENILIGTWAGGQRTRAKLHGLRMHRAGVEDQSWPVQHATGKHCAENQDSSLVSNLLIFQEERLVC